MALISDGFNTYTHGPDGELVPIQPEKMTLKIGENVLYDYDKETGVLKAAVAPTGLELLVGKIPADGADVVLPTPYGEMIRLQGVKRTESIEPYLVEFRRVERKNLFQKLVDNMF